MPRLWRVDVLKLAGRLATLVFVGLLSWLVVIQTRVPGTVHLDVQVGVLATTLGCAAAGAALTVVVWGRVIYRATLRPAWQAVQAHRATAAAVDL